jgi:hypothetical protein
MFTLNFLSEVAKNPKQANRLFSYPIIWLGTISAIP